LKKLIKHKAMNYIIKQFVLFVCGLLLTFQAFAADGIKTIIKGSVKGLGVKSLYLYNRDASHTVKSSAVIKADGLFQLAVGIAKPGFYFITSDVENQVSWHFYLSPGDQLTVKIVNNQLVLGGNGSSLNTFLFDLHQKYPYEADLVLAYSNRVTALKASTNTAVIRYKALLLGNEQGEYLDKVFGPLIESKAHGNAIIKADIGDLNVSLVPELIVYPNWWQTVTELMYAKMKAGQLKVRNMYTWVADFGNAIENPKLKEAFMLELLDNSAIMGDFRSIEQEMKAVIPLLKDPKSIAQVNLLKAKIKRNMGIFRYAPAGTDMSAYTFSDVNGKQVSIADFKGKLIYLDIWNTACMPCIAEMPYLNKLEQEMTGKEVVFLSVSCDYKIELWKNFLQKRNITNEHHLIINGTKDTFFDKIGKSGIPRFVILDKEGKVLDNNCCKRPSNPLLQIYLNELLNNPSK